MFSLEQSYDAYPRIEEAFQRDLDDSLHPRGPEFLFQLVADLSLPAGSSALDVGCGEGYHALRLAEQFGFAVAGIDPVGRHIAVANQTLSTQYPQLRDDVKFVLGHAEALPADAATVDLIWCRDVLSHVNAVDAAATEFRRVLRHGGHALVYLMVGTDRLEPREAAWLWATMGVVPSSADAQLVERALQAGGLRLEHRIVIGTEFGEWAEERTGKASRQLLHAARLLRDPDRYITKFGTAAYDIMLGDCLWHVYGMIGKLSRRVYLLERP